MKEVDKAKDYTVVTCGIGVTHENHTVRNGKGPLTTLHLSDGLVSHFYKSLS